MSISAIASDYVDRRYLVRTSVADPLAAKLRSSTDVDRGAPESGLKVDTLTELEKLTKYVPAEVVAAYTALINIVPADYNRTVLWGLYAFFVAITVVAIFCDAYKKWLKLPPERAAWRPPYFGMAAGLIAFAVWGAAVPGTVFQKLPDYQPWMGIAAAIIVTLVLQLIDGTLPEIHPAQFKRRTAHTH